MRKTWASAFVFIILSLNAIDAFTNPVPDTGQSCEGSCPSPGQPYYGQDGNYNINPPSYTKLDGTGKALLDSATSWVMVLDNVTGLIWEMKTNGDNVVNYNDIHDADNLYTYYLSYQDYHPVSGFIDALNSAYFGSYNDWRVPDIKELFSLLNFSDKLSQTAISINYFLYLSGSMSSTACVWPGYTMWCSAFRSGGYGPNSRSEGATVRAVRGFGYYGYGSSYKINDDGTVTDYSTGLAWRQDTPVNYMTWGQALSYCENSSFGGYTDWRLPTIKELQTLVAFNRYEPAINTTYFPDTLTLYPYWSSTYNGGAECVSFDRGFNQKIDKNARGYVLLVRGGQSGPTPTPTPTPTPPTPKIQANGQDGPITVTENTPVSVTVSLAPGDQNGKNADWWAAMFYDTWFSLTPYNTWALGVNSCAQKPLYSFSPVEIYNSTVSVGENIFCFGVDMSPNGILDSPLYADCVYVNGVTSTPIVKYEVVNSLSGKCIDVAGDPGKDNGSKIQIWDRQFSSDQKWEITQEGFIKNLLSGKCIDVDGAPGKDNGSKLQLWDCEVSGYNAYNNSPTDQKWEITQEGFIKNLLSGKCIDVGGAPGKDNGSKLQLWDCEVSGYNAYNNSPTDQKWFWIPL